MVREFKYRGYGLEQLQEMPMEQFLNLLPSRQRRSLNRELSHEKKVLIEKLRASNGKPVKSHARDMVILPFMVGKSLEVFNGKEYLKVDIKSEMLGHYLGEYATPIKKVVHGTPGIGASRSSLYVPLK
ncbi:MAG: 30S ribosomal protein S19 [Nitrososphaerota archaeon]|jgi:small subunit ribosomal protein S19|nr:30S ribosomal protein S19 [Nitrososphaerota archaeon]MDG7039421.1 30S ribosomal protein S19 [Nitrososphaerota archaeon]MDG7044468.1 30S ribosomal protein S19 [Nitrososphaerota archaeon]MDG7048722.1 30S ribosomal protein S19 [Nitrososphaerota archaeon]MDG7051686.1 30S ribosomal protein S19 [Nitrososphaerota archaeon]